MKCFRHSPVEAVGICAHCGRALCPECIPNAAAPSLTCSAACQEALSNGEKALALILQHSVRSAQASAFYCYLCGGLSAAAGVVAWFMLPSPFLILFTGGCGVALILSGVYYSRVGRRRSA